jgi:hypothetical protein
MLRQMKVPDAAVKSAVDKAQEQRYHAAVKSAVEKAQEQRYQLACGEVYKARYEKEIVHVTHPHLYFLQSQHDVSAGDAEAVVAGEP